MSLRAFHLFFIAVSVVLAAFVAAWAVGQYNAVHEVGYALFGAMALLTGAGMAVYGAMFQRKTKGLS